MREWKPTKAVIGHKRSSLYAGFRVMQRISKTLLIIRRPKLTEQFFLRTVQWNRRNIQRLPSGIYPAQIFTGRFDQHVTLNSSGQDIC